MSETASQGPVVLVILDGWGLEPASPGNAIELAETPTFDRLWATYPHATLRTSGVDVGLPRGQMGNSEVGHLNLGAGFVVYQSITRIDLAIEDGDFFRNPILVTAVQRASEGGRMLHLMGLLSDGGVHSHIRHLDALLDLAARAGDTNVAIHAFLDGRDTSPTGGAGYLSDTNRLIEKHRVGRIASVIGRYDAMDRDRRWERTREAFDLLVSGTGEPADDAIAAVETRYASGVTDEFMPPISILDDAGASTTIQPGDVVIFFNFRADRARQLTQALAGPPIEGQPFDAPEDITIVMMTQYADYLPAQTSFPAIDVVFPLARIVSEAGLRQFHTAETEKYAHVTYFFNGGREEVFDGEERGLIPSPKVATYDLQPEMSAEGVASAACLAIESGQFAFVIINFANCDMVGHTGVIAAAVAATEAVDTQLGRIVASALAAGGTVIITADHGNAEQMLVPGTNQPMTAHTTNPVPIIVVSPDDAPHRQTALRQDGRLADVAPTILELLHIALPSEMTGVSLLDPASTDD
ncbi:MAG: 2,3-bisphosphoglycerate-independent phosphoglycerate mutase [Chloroflexota bacterium]|nr:2,3-bisphosphoglycerate-independent phosphoglycerate mutase [Chloroflexota bacterium]